MRSREKTIDKVQEFIIILVLKMEYHNCKGQTSTSHYEGYITIVLIIPYITSPLSEAKKGLVMSIKLIELANCKSIKG